MSGPVGAGIDGALVEWNLGKHQMLGSTDTKGRYAFEIPLNGSGTNPETVMISAQANTYLIPAVQKVRLCPGNTYPVNFQLKPEPTNHIGTVHGKVIDPKTGKGIPNAIIAILIGHRLPVANGDTDDNGNYSIPGVGFGNGLTLTVNTIAPPCVTPAAHNFSVHQAMVTENFKLPTMTTGRLRCTGITGPEVGPETDSRVRPRLNTPLANDPTINWGISTADAILQDDSIDAWNSGHINDILKIGPSQALVASETSGVWSVAWSSNSAAAIPVSSAWGAINMTSLAQGPDGTAHVYAGTDNGDPTSTGGVLWETDTSSMAPLIDWLQDNPAPPCNAIKHILVISEFRRVVVACDNGLWWSPIPPAPSAHGTYQWEKAMAAPGLKAGILDRQFARLAKGPGWGSVGAPPTEGTIAVSAWGGTAPGDLIFYGGWKSGHLVLNSASVATGPGNLFLTVGRTSVAACALDAHTMYAVAADTSNSPDLVKVWESSGGGQNWAMVNLPPNGAPPNATGHQGDYNQAIAVSPADCNTFAIGWEYSSFASFDGGNTYPMPLNGAASGSGGHCCHLHDDYHALLFDPFDPQTLWFGSDGGLASASGVVNAGSPTFASYYNEHIADLQFYHASPSFHTSNLVAGPLQDNATVWSVLPNWWARVPGSSGDGAYTEFTGVGPPSATGGPPGSTDSLAWAQHGSPWQQSNWDGSAFTSSPSVIPVADQNNPRDPIGIPESVNLNVRSPSYTNTAGELMYVVAGSGQTVYGLFANSDASDMHWENLGSIGGGQNVTAVSSFNGNAVFVGTDQGNIYQLTLPYTGPALQFAIDEPAGGTRQINGLLEFFPTIAYAATGSGSGPGYVLNFLGQSWEVAGGGLPTTLPYVGVDASGLALIFAATSTQVFDSRDGGTTWDTASDGLPSVPHINEIHYVAQPDSRQYLYLSSYGWSMLRALIP